MAKLLLICALGCIAFGVLGAGLGDFLLWLNGRETISQFLRDEPRWFWVPVAITVVFLVGLAIHLYVLPSIFPSWGRRG